MTAPRKWWKNLASSRGLGWPETVQGDPGWSRHRETRPGPLSVAWKLVPGSLLRCQSLPGSSENVSNGPEACVPAGT